MNLENKTKNGELRNSHGTDKGINKKRGERMRGNRISQILLAVAIFGIITTAVEAGSYNRNTAASYAYNNAYNDVPWSSWYRANGGDCTNFVSNALQAGGWTETGKYFYTSNYAWYIDWNYPPGYSYTWGAANNFYRFLFYSGRATSVSSPDQLKIGDVVQMDGVNGQAADGTWDHTMMVTGINSRGALVSYHTPNTQNKQLQDIMNSNPKSRFMGWYIKDTYSG